MNTLIAAVQLFRPLNLLLGGLAVLITATLLPAWPAGRDLLWVLATVLCYNAAANALNDHFDFSADRVNRPGRPLPRGALPREAGWWLALVLFVLGSVAAMQLPPSATRIAVFVALPLMVLYSPLLKGLPLAGNLVVAAILGLTFLFAGAAFGQLPVMWPAAGLAFGFTLVREQVKDMEDLAGDRQAGIGTYPVRYGLGAGIKMAQATTYLLMFGCLVPYILGIYNTTFLVAVIIGVELPLLYAYRYLGQHPNPMGCAWVARVLKVDIFAGLLAIYLSRFDLG